MPSILFLYQVLSDIKTVNIIATMMVSLIL